MNRSLQIQFWNKNAAKDYLRLIGLIIGWVLFARQAYLSLFALNELGSWISWSSLLLPTGICVCFYMIQMLSWALIMECLKTPVGINETIKGYALSFLPRYIPGSVWGYWSRNQWLKHALGASYTISTLGSIIEAIAFVITAVAISLCVLGEKLGKVTPIMIFISLVLCWLLLGAIITIILSKRLSGISAQQPVRFVHLGFLLKWLTILGAYIAFWILYGATVALIAQTDTPLYRAQTTIACAALAWVAGFVVIIIPGGLGVREMTLANLLNSTIGLPLSMGRLVAVAFRVTTILAEIFWLLIGLLFRYLPKYRG